MNKTANYQLTIIVPVYNEEGNILRLEQELGDFLKAAKGSSCVLFVNDGSTDRSKPLILEACHRNNDFFFLNLARNGGLSAAMKAGIDYAYSRWVGYIDADHRNNADQPVIEGKILSGLDLHQDRHGFHFLFHILHDPGSALAHDGGISQTILTGLLTCKGIPVAVHLKKHLGIGPDHIQLLSPHRTVQLVGSQFPGQESNQQPWSPSNASMES